MELGTLSLISTDIRNRFSNACLIRFPENVHSPCECKFSAPSSNLGVFIVFSGLRIQIP